MDFKLSLYQTLDQGSLDIHNRANPLGFIDYLSQFKMPSLNS